MDLKKILFWLFGFKLNILILMPSKIILEVALQKDGRAGVI